MEEATQATKAQTGGKTFKGSQGNRCCLGTSIEFMKTEVSGGSRER